MTSPRALFVLCGLSLALPAAAASPEECTLTKSIKVSVKKGGATSWEPLPAGARLEILARGATWTDVVAPMGRGRVATTVLTEACPAAPAPAPASASASVPAAADAPLALVTPAPPIAPAAVEAPLVAAPLVAAPLVAAPAVAPVVEAAAPAVEPAAPFEPAPLEVRAEPAAAVLVTKRLVAVLDFKAGVGAEGVAQALTTIVTAEVGARDGLSALSRNELRAIVANQANAALMGCESVSCAADLAKLANAELVVAGTVERLGAAHVLSLTLIDPAIPAVLDRQEVAWRGPADEMISLARPYVDRLFAGGKAASYQGALEVFAPDGALVVVDGKAIGTAPLKAPIHALATGVHTIDITRDGFGSHNSEVVVARNETTIARVELVEEPFYTQWWFWTATGGSVLVAGGVVAGLTTLGVFESIKDKPARVVLGAP